MDAQATYSCSFTQSDLGPVVELPAVPPGAFHSVGFISHSRTRTPRRPSRPVSAQTNTAILG